jgi:hypothetical protein
MKTFVALLVLAVASALAAGTPAQSEEGPPAWAYPVNPPDFKPTPDDGTLRRVPGSTATYTLTQLRDRFIAPDWHPDDILPCPTWSHEAESLMCLLAAFVTGQTGLAVPKTRGSPVFLRPISSSRWPILRAVFGRLRCHKEAQIN